MSDTLSSVVPVFARRNKTNVIPYLLVQTGCLVRPPFHPSFTIPHIHIQHLPLQWNNTRTFPAYCAPLWSYRIQGHTKQAVVIITSLCLYVVHCTPLRWRCLVLTVFSVRSLLLVGSTNTLLLISKRTRKLQLDRCFTTEAELAKHSLISQLVSWLLQRVTPFSSCFRLLEGPRCR